MRQTPNDVRYIYTHTYTHTRIYGREKEEVQEKKEEIGRDDSGGLTQTENHVREGREHISLSLFSFLPLYLLVSPRLRCFFILFLLIIDPYRRFQRFSCLLNKGNVHRRLGLRAFVSEVHVDVQIQLRATRHKE